MILYFSGTGNSQFVATEIAKLTSDEVIDIGLCMRSNNSVLNVSSHKTIGIVCPIHAWRIPKVVLDYILSITNQMENKYIYLIVTCGEDAGLSAKVLSKELSKKGLKLSASFSIKMPNNYIIGSKLDGDEVNKKIIDEAIGKLGKIADDIINQKNVYDIHEGKLATIKTKLMSKCFEKFVVTAKPFYATDKCISCKLCEKQCPTRNIQAVDKPVWGDNCSLCLGCINRCPSTAIEYGTATKGRLRYYFGIDKKN